MSNWSTDSQGQQFTSDNPHTAEHGSPVNKSTGNGSTKPAQIVGDSVVETK